MSNTNMSAFPVPNDANNNNKKGMTLRDRFAAAAMQGLLSNPEVTLGLDAKQIAQDSYATADAMMKARKLK